MKIFALLCLLMLLAVGFAAPALAQVSPAETPTPDPLTYSDPGMSYTAPAGAVLMERQEVPLEELGQDMTSVAGWLIDPGKEDAREIQISMEGYHGSAEQWEGQFESETHGGQEGTLIRNKTPMTLLNGMPAYFVEVASGSGFDAHKEYAIVWTDGERGVVLAETTRLGDGSDEEARRVLKQVTAVRYPVNQP
jgi:hypothetical protein